MYAFTELAAHTVDRSLTIHTYLKESYQQTKCTQTKIALALAMRIVREPCEGNVSENSNDRRTQVLSGISFGLRHTSRLSRQSMV